MYKCIAIKDGYMDDGTPFALKDAIYEYSYSINKSLNMNRYPYRVYDERRMITRGTHQMGKKFFDEFFEDIKDY